MNSDENFPGGAASQILRTRRSQKNINKSEVGYTYILDQRYTISKETRHKRGMAVQKFAQPKPRVEGQARDLAARERQKLSKDRGKKGKQKFADLLGKARDLTLRQTG